MVTNNLFNIKETTLIVKFGLILFSDTLRVPNGDICPLFLDCNERRKSHYQSLCISTIWTSLLSPATSFPIETHKKLTPGDHSTLNCNDVLTVDRTCTNSSLFLIVAHNNQFGYLIASFRN